MPGRNGSPIYTLSITFPSGLILSIYFPWRSFAGRVLSRTRAACQPGRSTVPTAWEREQKERHVAEREAETSRRNELIDRKRANLENILSVGISRNIVLDYNARKLPLPALDAGELDIPTKSQLWKNSSLMNLARLHEWFPDGKLATRRNGCGLRRSSKQPMQSGNVLRENAKKTGKAACRL